MAARMGLRSGGVVWLLDRPTRTVHAGNGGPALANFHPARRLGGRVCRRLNHIDGSFGSNPAIHPKQLINLTKFDGRLSSTALVPASNASHLIAQLSLHLCREKRQDVMITPTLLRHNASSIARQTLLRSSSRLTSTNRASITPQCLPNKIPSTFPSPTARRWETTTTPAKQGRKSRMPRSL